LNREEKGLR